ncbi:MAG: galactokinase [Candidatus Hydrogenedentota bacterium]
MFHKHFGGAPEFIVRAPGRVNIIGEHTDYNGGFVLPMAISAATWLAAGPRSDACIEAVAADLGRHGAAALDDCDWDTSEPWLDYITGVAMELRDMGYPLTGASVVITSSVPIGAGLSSSASLEMAALKMFEAMGEFSLEDDEAAHLGQRVENEFIGVDSGIMDQYVIRAAREGHALFLDCRSLEIEHVPVAFKDAVFVVAHTGVERGLADSAYNTRVAECKEAAEHLETALDRRSPASLREFSSQELGECRAAMPDRLYRRARHVITENERTLAAREAMKAGDAATLGDLMNASHASLRDDYEVTGPALDAMTAIARELPGCYGSRMTGAGFGGCTVSLAARENAEEFAETLMQTYKTQTGNEDITLVSEPAAGVSLIAC